MPYEMLTVLSVPTQHPFLYCINYHAAEKHAQARDAMACPPRSRGTAGAHGDSADDSAAGGDMLLSPWWVMFRLYDAEGRLPMLPSYHYAWGPLMRRML